MAELSEGATKAPLNFKSPIDLFKDVAPTLKTVSAKTVEVGRGMGDDLKQTGSEIKIVGQQIKEDAKETVTFLRDQAGKLSTADLTQTVDRVRKGVQTLDRKTDDFLVDALSQLDTASKQVKPAMEVAHAKTVQVVRGMGDDLKQVGGEIKILGQEIQQEAKNLKAQMKPTVQRVQQAVRQVEAKLDVGAVKVVEAVQHNAPVVEAALKDAKIQAAQVLKEVRTNVDKKMTQGAEYLVTKAAPQVEATLKDLQQKGTQAFQDAKAGVKPAVAVIQARVQQTEKALDKGLDKAVAFAIDKAPKVQAAVIDLQQKAGQEFSKLRTQAQPTIDAARSNVQQATKYVQKETQQLIQDVKPVIKAVEAKVHQVMESPQVKAAEAILREKAQAATKKISDLASKVTATVMNPKPAIGALTDKLHKLNNSPEVQAASSMVHKATDRIKANLPTVTVPTIRLPDVVEKAQSVKKFVLDIPKPRLALPAALVPGFLKRKAPTPAPVAAAPAPAAPEPAAPTPEPVAAKPATPAAPPVATAPTPAAPPVAANPATPAVPPVATVPTPPPVAAKPAEPALSPPAAPPAIDAPAAPTAAAPAKDSLKELIAENLKAALEFQQGKITLQALDDANKKLTAKVTEIKTKKAPADDLRIVNEAEKAGVFAKFDEVVANAKKAAGPAAPAPAATVPAAPQGKEGPNTGNPILDFIIGLLSNIKGFEGIGEKFGAKPREEGISKPANTPPAPGTRSATQPRTPATAHLGEGADPDEIDALEVTAQTAALENVGKEPEAKKQAVDAAVAEVRGRIENASPAEKHNVAVKESEKAKQHNTEVKDKKAGRTTDEPAKPLAVAPAPSLATGPIPTKEKATETMAPAILKGEYAKAADALRSFDRKFLDGDKTKAVNEAAADLMADPKMKDVITEVLKANPKIEQGLNAKQGVKSAPANDPTKGDDRYEATKAMVEKLSALAEFKKSVEAVVKADPTIADKSAAVTKAMTAAAKESKTQTPEQIRTAAKKNMATAGVITATVKEAAKDMDKHQQTLATDTAAMAGASLLNPIGAVGLAGKVAADTLVVADDWKKATDAVAKLNIKIATGSGQSVSMKEIGAMQPAAQASATPPAAGKGGVGG